MSSLLFLMLSGMNVQKELMERLNWMRNVPEIRLYDKQSTFGNISGMAAFTTSGITGR